LVYCPFTVRAYTSIVFILAPFRKMGKADSLKNPPDEI
jgi:hypothetical protein